MKKISKIKKEDTVKIISGKDKGREGRVERIFQKKNSVLIAGVNMYKKHTKGNHGIKAGIYDLPRPINIAKVMLICTNCKKMTRVGFVREKNEIKRVCKKCKKII